MLTFVGCICLFVYIHEYVRAYLFVVCMHTHETYMYADGVHEFKQMDVVYACQFDIQSWMTFQETEISAQPEFLKPIYLCVHIVIVLIYLGVHQNCSPSFLRNLWKFLNGHP